jgi:sulfur-oxidizing protein SoxB
MLARRAGCPTPCLLSREFASGRPPGAGFGLNARAAPAQALRGLYELPRFGNVSLLHMTDCHAQLLPIHFREPSVNLGVGPMRGKLPHLVGDHLLRAAKPAPGHAEAHALTYLDFDAAARRYGKVGGFAHLATLVKQLKASRPGALLLDGGDTWQGSATALWTQRPGHGRRLPSCWAWTS